MDVAVLTDHKSWTLLRRYVLTGPSHGHSHPGHQCCQRSKVETKRHWPSFDTEMLPIGCCSWSYHMIWWYLLLLEMSLVFYAFLWVFTGMIWHGISYAICIYKQTWHIKQTSGIWQQETALGPWPADPDVHRNCASRRLRSQWWSPGHRLADTTSNYKMNQYVNAYCAHTIMTMIYI